MPGTMALDATWYSASFAAGRVNDPRQALVTVSPVAGAPPCFASRFSSNRAATRSSTCFRSAANVVVLASRDCAWPAASTTTRAPEGALPLMTAHLISARWVVGGVVAVAELVVTGIPGDVRPGSASAAVAAALFDRHEQPSKKMASPTSRKTMVNFVHRRVVFHQAPSVDFAVVRPQADRLIHNVGRRLAELRELRGWTQQEAAEKLGTPLEKLQGDERGGNRLHRSSVG